MPESVHRPIGIDHALASGKAPNKDLMGWQKKRTSTKQNGFRKFAHAKNPEAIFSFLKKIKKFIFLFSITQIDFFTAYNFANLSEENTFCVLKCLGGLTNFFRCAKMLY